MIFLFIGLGIVALLIAFAFFDPVNVVGIVLLMGASYAVHAAAGHLPSWIWLALLLIVPIMFFINGRRQGPTL